MATVDQVLKILRTLKPPANAAGKELNSVTGDVTPLEVWGLLQAVRMFSSLTPEQKTCIERLERFVTNQAAMKFTRLSRAQVALGAAARVCNNSLVDQKSFGMCGPAAMVMEIARTRPVEYVKLVEHLCDVGECTLRGLRIIPDDRIKNYDPGNDMPAVDWVLCASLRNDGDSLSGEVNKGIYGGTTTAEVYEWMVKAGYQKVVGISVLPFVQFHKSHPDSLKLPLVDPTDAEKVFAMAVNMSCDGWQVLLGGYMSITRAIVTLHQADTTAAAAETDGLPDVGKMIYDSALKDQTTKLMQPPPSRFDMIKEVASRPFGISPDDTRHWILVERMEPSSVSGELLTVTACSHGVRHRGINVPAKGLANKYFGFVAAKDT